MVTLVARVALVNGLRHAKTVPVQLSAASVITQRNYPTCSQSVAISRISFAPVGQNCNQLVPTKFARYFSSNNPKTVSDDAIDGGNGDRVPAKRIKPTLFQRFKQMYRDYWYVLVPVHLITSVGWFGGFYYIAKSGIDVVAIMESYNISSAIINPLKDSSLGYFAIAYAMYKIATPVRYTITLGGTTISINYLQKWGYIKPVPTREKLKEMYNTKRDIMIDTVKDKREELRLKKEQFKDRTDNLIDDMERKIVTKINDTKKKTTHTIEKP